MAAKNMLKSGREIDDRFIDMYLVRKAKENKIKISFGGFQPSSSKPEMLAAAGLREDIVVAMENQRFHN